MRNMIEPLQAWWASISQREQRLVIGCSILLLIGIVYWGLLQPLSQRAEIAQNRIQSEKQLLTWVTNKANEVLELRGSSGVAASQPLNLAVPASMRRFKIELIRVQPRGEMLQVWVKPVPFNQFVDWLIYLKEKQGIEVEFMDIDRSDNPGVIEVNRLQFKRG